MIYDLKIKKLLPVLLVVILQLAVVFEFYFFSVIQPCWKSDIFDISFHPFVAQIKHVSILIACAIMGGTHFAALLVSLIFFDMDSSKVKKYMSASEVIWEFVYKPKLFYLSRLTFWPYNKQNFIINTPVFRDRWMLSEWAINEMFKTRLTEMYFLIPFLFLYLFFLTVSPQKIFFVSSLLSLSLANALFDMIWFALSRSFGESCAPEFRSF